MSDEILRHRIGATFVWRWRSRRLRVGRVLNLYMSVDGPEYSDLETSARNAFGRYGCGRRDGVQGVAVQSAVQLRDSTAVVL
jgi:hypothetical protein